MNGVPDVLVVGAGIAGVSTAFHLARAGARVTIADPRAPLSLTSDKSTEAYRNWWPSAEMVAFMDRSIDLLERYSIESTDVFGLGRRGYLFVTSDRSTLEAKIAEARAVSDVGAGPVRHHRGGRSGYTPSPTEGWEGSPTGADVFTDAESLHSAFPYLTPAAVGGVHVRRAGWLSAHQLGTWMLGDARRRGAKSMTAGVESISVGANGFDVALSDGTAVSAHAMVNCAGPLLNSVAALVGETLPIHSELHLKVAFRDHLGTVPREAPMLIWNDPQSLDWSPEEREALAEMGRADVLDLMPPFCHGRPEGRGDSTWMLGLWEYSRKVIDPVWPLPRDEIYAEAVIRGLSTMVPGLGGYRDRLPHSVIDGGYYTKTDENRLLVGPTSVPGMFVVGALSGYGIMAACAAGELAAAHVLGLDLPAYARAFAPHRYLDPGYRPGIETDPSSGQL